MQVARAVSGGGGSPETGPGPQTRQAAIAEDAGADCRHHHREPRDAVADKPREQEGERHAAGNESEIPHQTQHPQPEVQPPDEVVEGKMRRIVQRGSPRPPDPPVDRICGVYSLGNTSRHSRAGRGGAG